MKAIFTTKKDFSANYFRAHGWDTYIYGDDVEYKNYEIVYFRDPFNDKEYIPDGKELDKLFRKFSSAVSIDKIRSFNQIVDIEDKYNQALLYKEYSPNTFLPSEIDFCDGKHLAKPRISQRAKNILFKLDQPIDDKWIVQELLDIKEELRVYAIFGNVVPLATIKSSKSSGKVKVLGGRKLTVAEIDFCEKIAQKSGLDFIGIDLAVLPNNELKIIEVNRSPQFKRFVEIYGDIPLAEILDL